MQIGHQAQAVLLLTVHLGKDDRQETKPLTNGEWARLAHWLKEHDLQPASLLTGDVESVLSGFVDRSITAQRVRRLLERGGAFGLSLERWQRAGLWVLTRSDAEYPERLKRRLGRDSPPALFGAGNQALLNSGGVAVVGSRDASESDAAFAEAIGRDAALQGLSVVSGGARGVDQSAMLGALQREGTAVGVLADSLLRSATSSAYRRHLMSNDLALVSPFSPEAGFSVGNAMARNRYIYCLADAAIVVSCTSEKGGTWHGAVEDLKAGWVPLWVKRPAGSTSDNGDLVRQGARWLPDPPLNLSTLAAAAGDLPTDRGLPVPPRQPAAAPDPAKVAPPRASIAQSAPEVSRLPAASPSPHAGQQACPFYRLFLERMLAATAAKALTAQELAEQLELTKQQVAAWLKRAVAEKAVRKSVRPVRYEGVTGQKAQRSLFGED